MIMGGNGKRRRWRQYETASGRKPVSEFLDTLADEDVAAIAAVMAEVRQEGVVAARHLRGDIHEVRAHGATQAFRVLFAPEGRHGQVLLALEGFSKRSRKTPVGVLELAERRLNDWRQRGGHGGGH